MVPTIKDLAGIMNIQQNLLQARAIWLCREMKDISLLLSKQTLIEKVKETQDSKPKGTPVPHKGQIIQAENISPTNMALECASSYGDSVCKDLDNCLEKVNSNIRQIERMKTATNSLTKACRSTLFTNTLLTVALICITCGLLSLLPLPIIMIKATGATAVSLAVTSQSVMWLHTKCNAAAILLITVSNAYLCGHNKRFGCALAGTIIAIVLITGLISDSNQITMNFISITKPVMGWMTGTNFGYSVAEFARNVSSTMTRLTVAIQTLNVVLTINWINMYPQIIGAIAAIIHYFTIDSSAIIHLTTVYVLILIYVGGVVGAYAGAPFGYSATIIGAAIGGALAALCGLALATSCKLAYYEIEERMEETNRCLNKTTCELKRSQATIRRVITEYHELPQMLHDLKV